MDNFEACFQLQDIKQEKPESPMTAKIAVGNEEVTVDINLFYHSNLVTKNNKTDTNPSDSFTESYCEAVKKLKITDESSKIFLNIISGKPTKFTPNNFFDLFKLSKYFGINDILTFLQEKCQTINDTKVIFSVLQNGKITKEEIEYFIRFLSCGQMKEKLGEKINECFELNFFTPELPITAIYLILESCKSIDSFSTSKLYEMIMQSFDKNLCLIPFLDFYSLDENQKTSFRKSFFEHIKKMRQSKSENDAKQSPNYLLENQIKLNEIKMNEMGKKIDELQIENEQLKKRIEESASNTNSNESSQLNDKHKIDELQTENDQLKKLLTKYNEYKQKCKSLTNENEKLKNEIDANASKSVSADSSKDSSKIENKIDDLQAENEQLNVKLNKISTKYNVYKQKFNSLNDENEQLKMNQKKLCDSLEELSSKYDELYKNYSNLQTENKQLKNQRDDINELTNSNPVKRRSLGKDHTDESNTHPHLTQKNYNRIKIFNENKDIVHLGYYMYCSLRYDIKDDIEYSIENTKLISANEPLAYDSKRKKCKQIDKSRIYMKIEVTKKSTFAAAIENKFLYKKLCVLNFASATKPGGGVLNGRNAQEESLARQSTLYFSLVKQNKFYDYNNEHYDSFGTDYMIYSPNIIILRDDNDMLRDPVKVSVISSVAVNYSELKDHDIADLDQKVYDIMKNRCRRILELCLAKGNEVIILGAFGCGVFKNPPKIISRIFKELLIDEAIGMEFKKVVFAILTKPNSSDELYKVFCNAFKKYP